MKGYRFVRAYRKAMKDWIERERLQYTDDQITFTDRALTPVYDGILKGLNGRRACIIKTIAAHYVPVSTETISTESGIGRNVLATHLERLRRAGIVKVKGTDKPRTLPRLWALKEDDFYRYHAYRSDPNFSEWLQEHPDTESSDVIDVYIDERRKLTA